MYTSVSILHGRRLPLVPSTFSVHINHTVFQLHRPLSNIYPVHEFVILFRGVVIAKSFRHLRTTRGLPNATLAGAKGRRGNRVRRVDLCESVWIRCWRLRFISVHPNIVSVYIRQIHIPFNTLDWLQNAGILALVRFQKQCRLLRNTFFRRRLVLTTTLALILCSQISTDY